MKINVDRTVLNIDGKPFEPETSLRAALSEALLASLPGDEKLGLKEKLEVHQLAFRVHNEKENPLELTAEQLALIKERCAKSYSIHVVGQIVAMLEGSPQSQ